MGLLTVLYRDDAIVAIDKPDALLVHRSRQSRDHVVALQLLRDQLGCYVHPVHRLDRATSGVLLFALSSEVAAALGKQFAERHVTKTYWAVVRGHLMGTATVDHPLREDGKGDLQEAVTVYRNLATGTLDVPVGRHPETRFSLLELVPKTGRMHQLRRHMKHLHHPLVGDTKYGEGRLNRVFRDTCNLHRLLLFARRLEFTHPVTHSPLRIDAPLPPDILPLFAAHRWPTELSA